MDLVSSSVGLGDELLELVMEEGWGMSCLRELALTKQDSDVF